jgi:hypothetical protein
MGLFDRFRRSEPERVIEDPLFGRLEYSETGCWRGDVFFEPADDEIGVEVASKGAAPTEEQRQTFVQLGERYASLSDSIARALFELYADRAGALAAKGLPKARSSADLATLTQLNWVEIGGGAELKVGYGFRDAVGCDDMVFTVRIKDWKPSGESLDGDDEA